jgi:hypothetical protein
MRFTVGAKTTSLPLAFASLPMTDPCRRASERSKVDARAIGAGIEVAMPERTPTGPSL